MYPWTNCSESSVMVRLEFYLPQSPPKGQLGDGLLTLNCWRLFEALWWPMGRWLTKFKLVVHVARFGTFSEQCLGSWWSSRGHHLAGESLTSWVNLAKALHPCSSLLIHLLKGILEYIIIRAPRFKTVGQGGRGRGIWHGNRGICNLGGRRSQSGKSWYLNRNHFFL